MPTSTKKSVKFAPEVKSRSPAKSKTRSRAPSQSQRMDFTTSVTRLNNIQLWNLYVTNRTDIDQVTEQAQLFVRTCQRLKGRQTTACFRELDSIVLDLDALRFENDALYEEDNLAGIKRLSKRIAGIAQSALKAQKEYFMAAFTEKRAQAQAQTRGRRVRA